MKRKKRKYIKQVKPGGFAVIDNTNSLPETGILDTDRTSSEPITCPACNGTKHIVHQGVEFPCPTCRKR